MLKQFLRRHWAVLLILALVSINYCMFLAGRDYININHENTKHLRTAVRMTLLLRHGHPLLAWETGLYPPLSYMPTVFLMLCSNICTDTVALLSQLPFIVLTGLGAYGIMRQMRCSTASALCAAFITSTAETVRVHQQGYLNEYALVAAVTMTYYFLLRSGLLLHRWSSLLCAVCMGACLLSKFSGPFFVLPGLTVVLYLIMRDREQRRTRLKHSLFFVICLAAAWLSWYTYPCIDNGSFKFDIGHLQHITGQINFFTNHDFEGCVFYEENDRPLWDQIKTVAERIYFDYKYFCFSINTWIYLGIAGLIGACWRCIRDSDSRYAVLTVLIGGLSSLTLCPMVHPVDSIRLGAPSQVFVLLPIVFAAEIWSAARYPCVIVISWLTLQLACYWFTPHLTGNKYLNAAQPDHTVPITRFIWRDPLGFFGPLSEQETLRFADELREYEARGYNPVIINSIELEYPLVSLYMYFKDEHTVIELQDAQNVIETYYDNRSTTKEISRTVKDETRQWNSKQPYVFILQYGVGRGNKECTQLDLDESRVKAPTLKLIRHLLSLIPPPERKVRLTVNMNRMEMQYYVTTAPLQNSLPLNCGTNQRRMRPDNERLQ